jgi:hypothetical protein
VARVANELGAGAPFASGMDVEIFVGELAEAVRLAWLEDVQMLSAEMLLWPDTPNLARFLGADGAAAS